MLHNPFSATCIVVERNRKQWFISEILRVALVSQDDWATNVHHNIYTHLSAHQTTKTERKPDTEVGRECSNFRLCLCRPFQRGSLHDTFCNIKQLPLVDILSSLHSCSGTLSFIFCDTKYWMPGVFLWGVGEERVVEATAEPRYFVTWGGAGEAIPLATQMGVESLSQGMLDGVQSQMSYN